MLYTLGSVSVDDGKIISYGSITITTVTVHTKTAPSAYAWRYTRPHRNVAFISKERLCLCVAPLCVVERDGLLGVRL